MKEKISYRYGIWVNDDREASCNFREWEISAEFLESGVKSNGITGMDVFIFNQNSTVESTYDRGTSDLIRLDYCLLLLTTKY